MYYAVMAKTRSIVAEKIEELLRIRDMSVAELSRASGVSEGSISNILSGVRQRPRSDTVQKIAKGFPTSVAYLNGDSTDPEPNDAPPLPDYAAEVLQEMRRLDRGRNYELLVIAKGFVSASEQIRQITKEEMAELLLNYADEKRGEGETNQITAWMEWLEKKWGKDGGDLPLLPEPTEPSE